MPNDSAEWQTKLVEDVTQQYGRLTKAGIEKFARAVPSGLFLAVDRLVNYYLMTEPPPAKAPAIGTKTVNMAPAKRTATKKTATKKTAAKKAPAIQTVPTKKAGVPKRPADREAPKPEAPIQLRVTERTRAKKAPAIGTKRIAKKAATKKPSRG